MEQDQINLENEIKNQKDKSSSKNKKWIIVILLVIVISVILLIGVLTLSKSKVSKNDLNNINNNSGNLAIKIDQDYYVMGIDFFIKIDQDNNIITNIGEDNNISSFTIEPNMQLYGDYIYYAVGGYYKKIYRYNYKQNKIELYQLPEEIKEASTANDGICSSYFIRESNLYYQPYAEDYYYVINLENGEYKQLNELEISEKVVVLSFEPNMYKDYIYYNKGNKLNYLNVSSNEINTIIEHKCNDVIIYNNKLYYNYNNEIYQSDLSGKNEELIYTNNESISHMIVNDKYLYLEYNDTLKIIDIKTKEIVNEISDCKNFSIVQDKLIVTNYQEKDSYSYELDGSNKVLIYKTIEEDKDNSNLEQEKQEDIADENTKESFNVILTSVGNNKTKVLTIVKNELEIELKEAKTLIEGESKVLKENISKEEAKDLKEKLEEVGATVELQ